MDVGKVGRDNDLTLLLGLYLFDGHPDWVADNYDQFVKPAVGRGNITAILIGNEDPQMIDTLTQYLGQVKSDSPQIPVGTSQTSDFWLSDGRRATPPARRFRRRQHLPGLGLGAGGREQPAGRGQAGSGVRIVLRDLQPDRGEVLRAAGRGHRDRLAHHVRPDRLAAIPGRHQQRARLSESRDRLGQAQQVVVYIHNMFDDQYGVDTSSPFNYHFGLIDYAGNPKGVLF